MPDTVALIMRSVDVVVIGAGQAGLSAAYHLQHRGFSPVTRAADHERTFVVLDAEQAPGGAWQHRWRSLTMNTVNGIHELPGFPVPPATPDAVSREVLPQYFAAYEERFELDVQRPVRVSSVRYPSTPGMSGTGLIVDSLDQRGSPVTLHARYVINATGTWTRPFWPTVPGQERFRGRQLHVHDYVSAEEFRGKRVVIVGAGISATQLLEEVSRVTETLWVTRREPEWVDRFTDGSIIASLAEVEERTRKGLPPQSVVRVTGMHRTPWIERAQARGALNLGYGASQSTVGANRAGRDAVRAILAEDRTMITEIDEGTLISH